MSRKTVIAHELEEGVVLALMRMPDFKIYLSLNIEASSKNIDPYRMPILWVDGSVYDTAIVKGLYDVTLSLDMPEGQFIFDDKSVTLQVSDNFDLTNKIIDCNKLEIRIYYKDYTIDHFDISSIDLREIQQKIRRDLLV